MRDPGVTALAIAILEQAASDYRDLNARGAQSAGDRNEGRYNITEIESFFRGSWCKKILNSLEVDTTGRRLLRALKQEVKQTRAKE